ncbi:Acyl-CoA desaturase [Hypsibius exemplaris]|uniref:Acyl-CoA desaturase n=1 Tax=Hypsibius exemplaris TaxID=2072580 RepID=A0A1W0WZL5_HYPEX|nr:Acyl-CoA desaturase [Hypsibius exemplaris]
MALQSQNFCLLRAQSASNSLYFLLLRQAFTRDRRDREPPRDLPSTNAVSYFLNDRTFPIVEFANRTLTGNGEKRKESGLAGRTSYCSLSLWSRMTRQSTAPLVSAVSGSDAIVRESPDNYISRTLKATLRPPALSWSNWHRELNWLNVGILTLIPLLALIGACFTKLRWETAIFSVIYYFFTGLGITAGYHRLWSHRSYNASKSLQYILAVGGAGAVEGSIKWWSQGHRAHHRYTDTDLDPYGAHRGLFWSHIGWMLRKPSGKLAAVDVSDLSKNEVVKWQHKHYLALASTMAFLVPTVIPWLLWGDAQGGYVYAGLVRLVFIQHSTFCVNSLAHWLGETPFDDKHSPRDHFLTALVTIGEGYHNFHHQFPMDHRNAIKWYQYDPTKWFIRCCQMIGLASHLKVFPENEVRKGQLTMQLQRLRETQDSLAWPTDTNNLPVISWESFQEQSAEHFLILISGFIHDVSTFLDVHPGGRAWLLSFVGKDATAAFFGGVYDHSNAAHNLLAMKRVGILQGGHPHAVEENSVPPSQRLKITRYDELSSTR